MLWPVSWPNSQRNFMLYRMQIVHEPTNEIFMMCDKIDTSFTFALLPFGSFWSLANRALRLSLIFILASCSGSSFQQICMEFELAVNSHLFFATSPNTCTECFNRLICAEMFFFLIFLSMNFILLFNVKHFLTQKRIQCKINGHNRIDAHELSEKERNK